MAYERRPPKGNKFATVDSFEEPPIQIPPSGQADSGFFSGFDNLHSDSFKKTSFGGKMNDGIKGPKVGSLESLVAKLAELHFVVKGKIDMDGKVEMMFCSPEPIVTQEPPKREPDVVLGPQPEVRFLEAPRVRAKRHEHGRRRTLF